MLPSANLLHPNQDGLPSEQKKDSLEDTSTCRQMCLQVMNIPLTPALLEVTTVILYRGRRDQRSLIGNKRVLPLVVLGLTVSHVSSLPLSNSIQIAEPAEKQA